MSRACVPMIIGVFLLIGCTAPTYLSVPPAVPIGQDRRLDPSLPAQAIVRDRHLGELRVELNFLEDDLIRLDQKRVNTCQQPGAAEPDTLAYHRCQFANQLYERRSDEVKLARERYLRAVSGSGGIGR